LLICIIRVVWNITVWNDLLMKATMPNSLWLQFAQCCKNTAGNYSCMFKFKKNIDIPVTRLPSYGRWRTTRPGDILDRRMRAALRAHGPKLEGVLFVAPFTYCIQQAWLQLCLCAVGIYNLYLACWEITRLQNFGVFVYQHFQLQLYSQVSETYLTRHQHLKSKPRVALYRAPLTP
jgi:hypothetical protein